MCRRRRVGNCFLPHNNMAAARNDRRQARLARQATAESDRLSCGLEALQANAESNHLSRELDKIAARNFAVSLTRALENFESNHSSDGEDGDIIEDLVHYGVWKGSPDWAMIDRRRSVGDDAQGDDAQGDDTQCHFNTDREAELTFVSQMQLATAVFSDRHSCQGIDEDVVDPLVAFALTGSRSEHYQDYFRSK